MKQIVEALTAIARGDQILENEPMSRHTTFRVGGPADVLFLPESEGQLVEALAAAGRAGVPTVVIGNGSNLLVRDGGIRGLVIALKNKGVKTVSPYLEIILCGMLLILGIIFTVSSTYNPFIYFNF